MKKWMCALLALLLCAAPAAGALAAGLTPLYELENADWIDGTNLLKILGRDGYCVAQMDGTPLTGEEFGRNFTYDDGLIVASKLSETDFNTTGALNLEGDEVIPFRYGDIKVLSSEWALAFTLVEATADNYDYQSLFGDSVYLIDTVDIYNLVSGACVSSLPRAQYADAEAYGHTINVEDRSSGVATAYDAEFNVVSSDLNGVYDDDYADMDVVVYRENGRAGLKDGEGNVVMEPAFQYIENFYENHAKVSTGDAYGLIDDEGNVILPAEFEAINRSSCRPTGSSGFDNIGYYCVEVDGKLGYAVAGGELTCKPKYSADALENNGASATYTDMEGNIHILAADGVESVIMGYARVNPADYASGVFYRVSDADYNYGLIDFHGNEVLPCAYEDLRMSGDGHYVLVEPEYNKCEIYELSYPEPGEAAGTGAADAAADVASAVDATDAGSAAEAPMLLNSAIMLLQQDAAANGGAVVSLLNEALGKLSADSPAAGMLVSAITLLEADASANGAAAVTLLQSASGLMS